MIYQRFDLVIRFRWTWKYLKHNFKNGVNFTCTYVSIEPVFSEYEAAVYPMANLKRCICTAVRGWLETQIKAVCSRIMLIWPKTDPNLLSIFLIDINNRKKSVRSRAIYKMDIRILLVSVIILFIILILLMYIMVNGFDCQCKCYFAKFLSLI